MVGWWGGRKLFGQKIRQQLQFINHPIMLFVLHKIPFVLRGCTSEKVFKTIFWLKSLSPSHGLKTFKTDTSTCAFDAWSPKSPEWGYSGGGFAPFLCRWLHSSGFQFVPATALAFFKQMAEHRNWVTRTHLRRCRGGHQLGKPTSTSDSIEVLYLGSWYVCRNQMSAVGCQTGRGWAAQAILHNYGKQRSHSNAFTLGIARTLSKSTC